MHIHICIWNVYEYINTCTNDGRVVIIINNKMKFLLPFALLILLLLFFFAFAVVVALFRTNRFVSFGRSKVVNGHERAHCAHLSIFRLLNYLVASACLRLTMPLHLSISRSRFLRTNCNIDDEVPHIDVAAATAHFVSATSRTRNAHIT